MTDDRALGWDADGMCDDHYRFGCPDCAVPATPAPSIPSGSDERAREVVPVGEGVNAPDRIWLCGFDTHHGDISWSSCPDPTDDPEVDGKQVEYVRAALAASRPTEAGAGLLREALERIQDEPLHTLPIVTTQRMRNIASYALRGERLA